MLDLDSLAEKRARTLNQEEELWRKVIWSTSFQQLSASMTDGEVEALVALCPSVTHLEKVVTFLESKVQVSGAAPFSLLEKEAKTAGASLEQWVQTLGGKSR